LFLSIESYLNLYYKLPKGIGVPNEIRAGQSRAGRQSGSLLYIASLYTPEVETVQYKSTDSTEYILLYISTQFACECGVLSTKTGGSIHGYVLKEAFKKKVNVKVKIPTDRRCVTLCVS
jgi:hypothetical protein